MVTSFQGFIGPGDASPHPRTTPGLAGRVPMETRMDLIASFPIWARMRLCRVFGHRFAYLTVSTEKFHLMRSVCSRCGRMDEFNPMNSQSLPRLGAEVRNCGSCRYWCDAPPGQNVYYSAPTGECRRRAPASIPIPGAKSRSADATWPLTGYFGGCGEHEAYVPKPEKPSIFDVTAETVKEAQEVLQDIRKTLK